MAKRGKHAMLEQLIADGTKYIFGNPGTTEQGFMDALQDYPQLKFILALHEGVAVTMGDAYARATGRPSIVELHTAPGLGNGLGMINNAARGHTPMIVFAGQADTRGLLSEPALGGDLVGMARPIVKWAAEARNADEVPMLLRRARKVAAEPPQGPVFLSMPLDVLEQETEAKIAATPATAWRARPNSEAVRAAAALLAAAKNPGLIVGDGVGTSGAQAEVSELAELAGAAIFGGGSEVNVEPNHRLAVGGFNQMMMGGNAIPDVLVMLGASEASTYSGPVPQLPDESRVIQINTSNWELAKNNLVEVAIAADVKETLTELNQVLRGQMSDEQKQEARRRADAIAERRKGELARLREEDARVRESVPIKGSRLWEELSAALPDNAAIFSAAGTTGQSLDRYIQLPPGRLFRSRGGGIGAGLGNTLGLQLAYPDRKVVGIEGDGSAMYCITALWTAAHHNLPVTYIICRNGMYRVLKVNMMIHLGEAAAGRQFVEMDLHEPVINYARIAESMGVRGFVVEHPNDLAETLRTAMAHPGPSLVDVVVDGTLPGRQD